jgi:hypothetical protein
MLRQAAQGYVHLLGASHMRKSQRILDEFAYLNVALLKTLLLVKRGCFDSHLQFTVHG